MSDNNFLPGWESTGYQPNAPIRTPENRSQGHRPTRPPMYHVVLINDTYTPCEFIVNVFKRFFQKTEDDALQLIYTMQHQGQAVCGLFTREVAEGKVMQVSDYARMNHYPIKCVMRKEQPHAIKKS